MYISPILSTYSLLKKANRTWRSFHQALIAGLSPAARKASRYTERCIVNDLTCDFFFCLCDSQILALSTASKSFSTLTQVFSIRDSQRLQQADFYHAWKWLPITFTYTQLCKKWPRYNKLITPAQDMAPLSCTHSSHSLSTHATPDLLTSVSITSSTSYFPHLTLPLRKQVNC